MLESNQEEKKVQKLVGFRIWGYGCKLRVRSFRVEGKDGELRLLGFRIEG
jgi:hypothetical protein